MKEGSEEIIMNPMVVNLKDGTKRVSIKMEEEDKMCKVELGRSSRLRNKAAIGTQILKDH